MTFRQKILAGILADEAHYAALEPPDLDGWERRQLQERIRAAQSGLVQLNHAAWLGKVLTPSDYTLCSRALKQLAAAGLVERHALGYSERQASHVSLTAAGRAEAEKLRVTT